METKQDRLAHGERAETAGTRTFNLAAVPGPGRSVFYCPLRSTWNWWEGQVGCSTLLRRRFYRLFPNDPLKYPTGGGRLLPPDF